MKKPGKIVGCLFHWKQVIRRYLKKLNIPSDQISMSVKKGMFDILTVLERKDLHIGITYIKEKIESKFPIASADSKWVKFWNYLDKIWLNRFSFED